MLLGGEVDWEGVGGGWDYQQMVRSAITCHATNQQLKDRHIETVLDAHRLGQHTS